MGEILFQSPSGPFKVKIAGDSPTGEEQIQIANLIRGQRQAVAEPQLAASTSSAQQQLFDTSSGIKDAGLRSLLSAAETPEEEGEGEEGGF